MDYAFIVTSHEHRSATDGLCDRAARVRCDASARPINVSPRHAFYSYVPSAITICAGRKMSSDSNVCIMYRKHRQ